MAPRRPHLSVVIPAYNEAERLPGSIPQVLRYLASEGYPHEVIVVDDGSADATSRIVEAIATEAPALRLLRTRHRGKAYAVRAGVLAARGERVLFTDADLSAPIAQAALLMRCLDDGYDIAIGSREGPGSRRYGEPAYRHIMGRAFNLAVRLITGAGYQDTQCGFKLFTRDAACDIFGRLLLYTDEAAPVAGPMVTGLDVEVLQVARRQGYRVREVGVEWHYSAGSKVRPALDTYRMLKDVARVKLNDVRGRYG